MSQPVLPKLPPGSRVQDPLIVLDIESRGGDIPHIILTLGNATGRLPSAPFWPSDGHKLAGVVKGTVVDVTGTVGSYRARRQLIVESLRVLPRAQVDWRCLMPSVGDVRRYWQAVDSWRGEIRGVRLARTLGLFYEDPEFRRRYEECPASTAGHHAELGGLLKHTWEVAQIALAICAVHSAAVDQELVLAGALLHDVGKLESYRWEGCFETSVPGAKLGHVVLGALLLERRVRAQSPMPCTETELMILEHLILSHHGALEFGASVPPLTLEAEILHHADNASAKTASMKGALEDADNFAGDEGLSIRGIWQLDRRRAWRGASDWGRADPKEGHHEEAVVKG